GFTRLISPIDGIAGIAQPHVGALVSPASGAVATVSTVDAIKVYFTVSEEEYLDYNQRFATQASRETETGRLSLELILADGTTYPHTGKFFFADRQMNQTKGAIRLARLFPNPGIFCGLNNTAAYARRPGHARAHCWSRSVVRSSSANLLTQLI